MADSVAAGTRRKKPPTFQHFPTNRAKALKKQWVEKTKIKSKWKAEKRKEGLISQSKLDLPTYSDEEDVQKGENVGDASDHPGVHEEKEASTRSPTRKTESQAPHMHPSQAHIHPDLPVKRTKSRPEQPGPEARPTKKQKISKEKEEAELTEQPSVRDLMREAYSKSTLHTYKSDPLKKRPSNFAPQRGGKGGNKERGQMGRGQPNMKLRMNAMLAKIKQDYAP